MALPHKCIVARAAVCWLRRSICVEMSQGNIAQSERWRPVKIFVIIALQELEIPQGLFRFLRVLLTRKIFMRAEPVECCDVA
ncbi:MAG: hypothetical protein LUH13_00465 [Oscillospiraceae bacterium]|nr:hypothetical protein [Oscillospiraceae bacterium]